MSVTYAALSDINLEQLSAAAEKWRKLDETLYDADDQAQNNLRPLLLSGEWSGEAASEGRSLGLSTALAFKHASRTAAMTHKTLDDLHAALTSCQRRLRAVAAEAGERGLPVQPDGTVTVPDQAVSADHPDARHAPTQADAEEVADDIRRILLEASNHDEAAKRALDELTGDEDRFTRPEVVDLDSAREDIIDLKAHQAIDLITNGDLTDEDLAELNELFEQYGEDPDFAETVALGAGPDAILSFWAGLYDPHPAPADRDGEYVPQILALQESFGSTLGMATQSDSPYMRKWENKMVALGDEQVHDQDGGGGLFGFQVMSSLMAHGEYGDEFLGDYGNALRKIEEEDAQYGLRWFRDPEPIPLAAHSEGAVDIDPTTGFMKALGNNPDAATEFFSGSDHTDYFLVERSYDGNEYSHLGDERNYAREATGEALFSASTGKPYDPVVQTSSETTPEQDEVFERSLAVLSEMGDEFPPEYRSSMANTLVVHGEKVIDTAGTPFSETPLQRRELMEVVTQTSRDPEAYGTLNAGMNSVLIDSFSDTETSLGTEIEPGSTLERAGRTIGFLESGRQQALHGEASDAQDAAVWDARWQYHASGSLLNLLPGGDVLQRGADVATQKWLEDESVRIDEELVKEKNDVSETRRNQLEYLAEKWNDVHGDWASEVDGYADEYRRVSKINGAANDANSEMQ